MKTNKKMCLSVYTKPIPKTYRDRNPKTAKQFEINFPLEKGTPFE